MWQPRLTDALSPQFGGPITRTYLDDDTWVDSADNWLTGAAELFAQLVDVLPWSTGSRPMYERMVDVPRLSAFFDGDLPGLPPLVTRLGDFFTKRYQRPFHQLSANLYRDGDDSVAWHGDRIGLVERNPIVVLVSLGSPRRFLLRPNGGGTSRRWQLGGGDLLVMGGACQHRFEHCVPKVRRAGPRMSLMFRHVARPGDQPDTTLGIVHRRAATPWRGRSTELA